MIIKPVLGIGDLLMFKMYFKHHNIHVDKIIITKKLIEKYRLNPTKYLLFLQQFIKNLYINTFIEINDNEFDETLHLNINNNDIDINNNINDNIYNNGIMLGIDNHDYDDCYLFDNYNFENKFNNIYGKYVVFHSKVRIDNYVDDFNKNISRLTNFLKNFRCRYKIIILGEKHVENNIETQIHRIFDIYKLLLKLKNNNVVIDLTYNELYSGNEYPNFEKDLHIINYAQYNIGFGFGGPLTICMAFSHNNIFFVDKLDRNCLINYNRINNNICSSFDDFLQKITLLCGLGY